MLIVFLFSGPYIFAISVGTYLVSKEIYILEHEYYNGLAMLIICVTGIKMYGPKVAKYLDENVDAVNKELDDSRNSEAAVHEELITHEKQQQSSLDGQKMIMDIKKENIKMQLEGTYRARMVEVYQEV